MFEEINVEQMNQLIKDKDAVLVDVRESEELENGTIEGYVHMPLSEFDEYKDQVSKDRPTIFYCRSGRRSITACQFAEEWTDQPLYSLAGGFIGYSNPDG